MKPNKGNLHKMTVGKQREKVIQSLEEIKSENLPDDCSIIVRLSYTMMPF